MLTQFTNLPFFRLARDARLIIISTAVLGISFFGIQMLLNVLYILRLSYSVEYVGIFNASGAFTYILSSLPAAAVGNRLGLRAAMILATVLSCVPSSVPGNGVVTACASGVAIAAVTVAAASIARRWISAKPRS